MKIKLHDNVLVIAGKDKGRKGKVLKAMPKLDMVIVEGVNVKKRHSKARKQGGKGEIVERTHPVHVSNVRIA